MDEQSGNLADESTETSESEAMSELVPHQSEELRKRRSTRIMQAVPLAVSGVDALGRPFTERTSTLIINCHGCRYQSKHYVLKNMWVTLEVPHSEAGQAPRTVRGRVAWIQRPRTVRQLFQVALELETPGNTWGIAFPPSDWFALPELGSIHESAHGASQESTMTAEIHLPLTEPEPSSAPRQDNLRTFPAPVSATDASLQLARHMARLLADAKQQMQATARELAAQAVAAEHRVSVDELEKKATAAREQLAQQVSGAIEKIQEESETRSRAAHGAAAETLQRELPQRIGPQLEQLTRELTQQISDRSAEEQAEHAQRLSAALDTLRSVCQQADDSAARLRSQTEEAQNQIANRSAEAARALEEVLRQREVSANAHREALDAAANQLQEQVKTSISASQSAWQGLLDTELSSAQTLWQSALESTILAAQEKAAAAFSEAVANHCSRLQEETARQTAAARESLAAASAEAEQRAAALANSFREDAERQSAATRELASSQIGATEQHVAALLSSLQEESARHIAEARESLTTAATEAEKRIAGLRHSLEEKSERLETALAHAAESSENLENFSARIDAAQHRALAGFETQIGDVLTLHRNELHRSSETLLEEINARIRATFDENCQRAISHFDQQIDGLVQPHVSKTEEAIHRLAGGRSLLDAALTLQQDRIRTAADEAFAESLARFRENLGGIDQLLQEAANTVTVRNLIEYESKISDLKHHTVDDLMKSAEWYEKKAQTQIQTLTEKTVEQADNQFRERAGEVSSVFASELDHSSRNFIGHTQTQMEEVVHDAFEHSRALFAEAADTTTAAFTDEIQRHARAELDGFNEEALRTLSETRNQLDAARADLTQKVTAEQEAFLIEFRARMSGAVDSGVSDAHRKVQSELAPLLESWKSTVEAHRNQMRATYQELSNLAAEQHRNRLENVSNQWMLATVASLDHQSREAVASIAAKAEERLRETCTQVFAGVGEALRERLQQIAAGFAAHQPQPPDAPQPPLSRSTTAGSTGSGS